MPRTEPTLFPDVEWQQQEKRYPSPHEEQPGDKRTKTWDPRIFGVIQSSPSDLVAKRDEEHWRWYYSDEAEPPDYLLFHRQDSAQEFYLNFVSELNGEYGAAQPEEIAKEHSAEYMASLTYGVAPPPVHTIDEIRSAHFLVDSGKPTQRSGDHAPICARDHGDHAPIGLEIEIPTYMVDPAHLPRMPEKDEIVVLHVLPHEYVFNIERELPVLTKEEEKETRQRTGRLYGQRVG